MKSDGSVFIGYSFDSGDTNDYDLTYMTKVTQVINLTKVTHVTQFTEVISDARFSHIHHNTCHGRVGKWGNERH